MDVPSQLHYTETHEWADLSQKPARMGLTRIAVDALGEITSIRTVPRGTQITKGEVLAEVESAKAVSEIAAPLTGTVSRINERLFSDPSLLTSSPYDEGWIAEVTTTATTGRPATLLSAEDYRELLRGE